jgi:hypothetical protein
MMSGIQVSCVSEAQLFYLHQEQHRRYNHDDTQPCLGIHGSGGEQSLHGAEVGKTQLE